MKNTTKDFITTTVSLIAVGLCLAATFADTFEADVYVSHLLCSLIGYFWCLNTHSKVINNEKH